LSRESEEYANPELVGGGETSLHSHAGGGSINIKSGTVSGLSGSVTFNTAFSSTPRVVMTVQGTTALRDCSFGKYNRFQLGSRCQHDIILDCNQCGEFVMPFPWRFPIRFAAYLGRWVKIVNITDGTGFSNVMDLTIFANLADNTGFENIRDGSSFGDIDDTTLFEEVTD
jgi:hypothetical protein